MPTRNTTSDDTSVVSEPGFRGAAGGRRDAILGSSSGLGSSDTGQTPAPLTSPLEEQSSAEQSRAALGAAPRRAEGRVLDWGHKDSRALAQGAARAWDSHGEARPRLAVTAKLPRWTLRNKRHFSRVSLALGMGGPASLVAQALGCHSLEAIWGCDHGTVCLGKEPQLGGESPGVYSGLVPSCCMTLSLGVSFLTCKLNVGGSAVEPRLGGYVALGCQQGVGWWGGVWTRGEWRPAGLKQNGCRSER